MNRTLQKLILGYMGCLVAVLFLAAWTNPPRTVANSKIQIAIPAGAPLPASRVWVTEEPLPPPAPKRAEASFSYASLAEAFGQLGYELAAVADGVAGVPRLILAALPHDLAEVPETAERKAIFFRAVLPLVLRVNEEILAERKKLLDIRKRLRAHTHIAQAERLWLQAMAERYETTPGDVEQLVNRVDTIPPSLALAQAAEESGWGSSRFVRDGNALFGQWTTVDEGHQLPLARDEGRTHRVAGFPSLLESTRAYARNLNSHRAYREFRDARADARAEGRTPSGFELAGKLARYSQRGAAYVNRLRGLIVVNELRDLDGAKLDEREVRLGDGRPMAGLIRRLSF
ncbi:MAG: glucosaminidase domain-containing protein [Rhodospirillales bacterium]|nr:glucosaminidase domain-containing protein [Rhodospirillales bacterium]